MTIDIAYFKQRLEDERIQLQAELDRVQDENNENMDTAKNSFGATNHPADDASRVMSLERNMAVSGDLQYELESVDHALTRIEDGTYGLCEEDGEPIPLERLEARPASTFCVRHQREREQV